MKHITLFLVVFFALSCEEEPAPQPVPSAPIDLYQEQEELPRLDWFGSDRNGTYAPLWYKESLTTDNYLLTPLPRTQTAYHKAKVDSVYMTRVGTNGVNIDGIPHGFYDVRVKFKNEATGQPVRYLSVLGANVINYIPYGANVLYAGNPYKTMTIIKTNEKMTYPEWLIGKPKNKWKYTIQADGVTLGTDYIAGSTPTGTVFTLPHK